MTEIICKLCGKPFETYVELGPEQFPVWMHDYPTLETCKVLRFKQDFVKQLKARRELVEKMLRAAESGAEKCPGLAEQFAVVRKFGKEE